MAEGQAIAPPPFNDRCIAVSGRCGYACMEQQSPALEHCDPSGSIFSEDLLGLEAFEPPTNEGAVVGLFVWTLLLGFAVKILTYTPGLFMPYKHAMHYTPNQTAKLKYIAVCVPSGAETKACVLRNIVGALSGLPSGCQCPFHVVFADEGHRHPQKVMFRALNRVLDAVPAATLTVSRVPTARSVTGTRSGANSPRTPRTKSYRPTSSRAVKEENLKLFLKHWTEKTRAFQLATCNTEKMAKRIKKLREDLLAGGGAADGARDKDLLRRDEASKKEIKSLEDMLDSLCGTSALRLLQSRYGWPAADSEEGREIRELEEAIQCLRAELTVGEKQVAGADGSADQVPACEDDYEDHSWLPSSTGASGASDEEAARARAPLYTMHYVARAKPDEDERTLKVQHVARGGWYYKVPFDEAKRQKKSWLEWRRNIYEFQDGDYDVNKVLVPVRTSRGKAGGLNFVENYLRIYSNTTFVNRCRLAVWTQCASSHPCSASPTPGTSSSQTSST
ncbi:unnamed protein product [Prorocentrum cordatum]|uniref:Uncharacterized protein n=1 Tax=Prorocentrum cordatum TaxID=2364126 RepID=A0ABN9SR28_9DINO|nr:unnamed protein product [Polarella glacialis]